ncbi:MULTISPECIES: MarR family transcriptional regulator [unclassified Rhizobium]|jgi:DNA-binding MarR family transcriptional regulator|uniref:MarR family winged helix-turn-helix transcriptional regulator n=1 Tax=unclassified Rhizobium TaxID=2613769 RepID=UPI0006490983|nr:MULTISPECIES: MarR family transcriptional regulator [unclassified Rhizobium]OJY71923.1 MAG: MarR family transcriptional regulator [Rhizobium sp. 60-20]RKD40529.1 DNA-binding MarR family transcriptional regulator [Rhizobium sp. WW_1]
MATISKLTDHTGYWMRMVSNAVSQEFARKVSGEDVTVAEWSFMRALYDSEPMAPSALAEKMGMTKGAISKLAERLVAKGLVVREESQKDKRAHKLSMTTEGRAKIPALAALADENDAEFFDLLTKEEHEALDRILKALAERCEIKAIPVD